MYKILHIPSSSYMLYYTRNKLYTSLTHPNIIENFYLKAELYIVFGLDNFLLKYYEDALFNSKTLAKNTLTKYLKMIKTDSTRKDLDIYYLPFVLNENYFDIIKV